MIVQTMPPITGAPTVTPAEFKTVREGLGFTLDEIAEYLDVAPRTTRNWEQGKYPIPPGAEDDIRALERFTDALVDELERFTATVLTTYRDDAEFHRARPEMTRYPAKWHRAATARAARRTGLRIEFPE